MLTPTVWLHLAWRGILWCKIENIQLKCKGRKFIHIFLSNKYLNSYFIMFWMERQFFGYLLQLVIKENIVFWFGRKLSSKISCHLFYSKNDAIRECHFYVENKFSLLKTCCTLPRHDVCVPTPSCESNKVSHKKYDDSSHTDTGGSGWGCGRGAKQSQAKKKVFKKWQHTHLSIYLTVVDGFWIGWIQRWLIWKRLHIKVD